MLNTCLILIMILLATVACGSFLQQNVFIKLLFVNTSTSLAALLICFLGAFTCNSSYIDIALIYFLLSLPTTYSYSEYLIDKHKKK